VTISLSVNVITMSKYVSERFDVAKMTKLSKLVLALARVDLNVIFKLFHVERSF